MAQVLAGSGQVGASPVAYLEFRDEADQILGTAFETGPAIDPTAGLAVFDDLGYEAPVPAGTAFIVFALHDNITLMSDPGNQLQVRFVTRLDDAYLALTLPEAEPAAAGAAALAALAAYAAARRRR